jgi:hypothetical protein
MAEGKSRQLVRLVLRWILGCVISVVLLFVLVKLGIIASPDNYVIVDGFSEHRLNIAAAWVFGFAQTLGFGARWLEAEEKRLYHPLLIGLVSALAALGSVLLVESDANPGLSFWLLAGGANLVAVVAAAQLRLPTPPVYRRGWVLLGTFVVSAIGWYLLSPKALDFPHDAYSEERHQWAVENVGEPYEAVAEWATNCSALQEKLGPPLQVAPATRGDFRIDRSSGVRATIDVVVAGAEETGDCRFDATVDSGLPDDVVAMCKLPGIPRYQVPRSCDCSGCSWACDEPYSTVTPDEETLPANLPAVVVFDRVIACDEDALPCDVSTRSKASGFRLVHLDGDRKQEVDVEVESPWDEAYRVVFDEPLVEGERYRLSWEESVCGTNTFEFTAIAEKPLETRFRLEETDVSNVVRLSLESEQPWVDETAFTLKVDGLLERWDEEIELPCDEPGPTEVTIEADPVIDERLIARRVHRYECPAD